MRKKRLAKNTISSFVFQFTTIICGFILPRLILSQYGSEVNGLVNSINQFLGIIAFLELGVGAVVQSSLYKPLAEKNDRVVSEVLVSAGKFFKQLARILLVYVIGLIVLYPKIANQQFDFLFTATLIAAISISSFAQYYFGVVDSLLLTADQKGYLQYNMQTFTLILNTIACIVLITLGSSIQVLKLTSSIIYLIRPVFFRVYVNKKYNIDRKAIYTNEPIKQKWNGVAQHVAAIILDSTDNIVLTIFATLSDVSVYSVYFLVVNGVKRLFLSLTNGIQALIGELWAKQELDELTSLFSWVEWVIHSVVSLTFGCTLFLIVPFVQVYTRGITDTNYIQPLFGALITIANAAHCLRLPYNIMILAAGHYKQTQHNYVIAAVLNVVTSIVMVKQFGLIGVAIGTIIAMVYQTVWMAIYNSKNFIHWKFSYFVKQILVDIGVLGSSYFIIRLISFSEVTILSWGILAIKVFLVLSMVSLVFNLIFYRNKVLSVTRKLKTKICK